MKIRNRHNLVATALGVVLAFAATAASAACYNGYCPNASSPVVGGWVSSTPAETHETCSTFGSTIISCTASPVPGYFFPFGNVSVNGVTNQGAGTYAATSASCPPNTADIKVPGGYLADNGVTYDTYTPTGGQPTKGTTFVCVQTDTAGN